MSDAGTIPPGWYPEQPGSATERWWDGRSWSDHTRAAGSEAAMVPTSTPSGAAAPSYVVLQVVLKERLLGSGSGNLTELERVINAQAAKGYRLHTITTASSGIKGLGGGDRIQATLVFERLS